MSELVLAPEIFDRLRQATAGDSATLAELCREYVSEARTTITNIRQALLHKDAAQLRERAHYLKGSSMMIGANTLAQHCATLERMGRDADLGEAEAALEQAVAALKAVEDELSRSVGSVALPAEGSAA
jgi:HPt (histidine-containing phosphotransfer) domain-containing protein